MFPSNEKILLIGDADRNVHAALAQAMPAAEVTAVGSYFDAIAELSLSRYSTVLAAAQPIERRPEAAVKSLRQFCPDGRILLFGTPDFEPLSRKMLEIGTDDYVITPASAAELQQVFGSPPMRLTPEPADAETEAAKTPSRVGQLAGLPLSEIILDVLLQKPKDAVAATLKQVNARIGPTMALQVNKPGEEPPAAEGQTVLTHALKGENAGTVSLTLPQDEEPTGPRHMLAQLAQQLGKLKVLSARQDDMERLLIHDELTGVYNARFFRLSLKRLTEAALRQNTAVTLLLFDIDNFKKYNDQHGHTVGDEILKQTAALMKRCTRDHDIVARISGDEFAVIFWEKEGPRKSLHAHRPGAVSGARIPTTPRQVFERCQRLLASPDFQVLGASGQGTLTISGGMAVFPWSARTPEELYEAADRALMFGAKKCGKDSLYLVGGEEESGA